MTVAAELNPDRGVEEEEQRGEGSARQPGDSPRG